MSAVPRRRSRPARRRPTPSSPVAGGIAVAHHRAMAMPLDRLLTLPIVQAPMAGVSTPAMAAAVSTAGALGSIAVGASTAGDAAAMIAATRAATDRPFNVNLFVHAPPQADAAREA